MQARMAVLKTWGNAWSTSERYHENLILPCIFGCGGRDNLTHYSNCESFALLGVPGPLISCAGENHSVIGAFSPRLCLSLVTPDSILSCLVAFKVYHAMKIESRELIADAVRMGDFSSVWDKARELSTIFTRDLDVSGA